MIDVCSGSGFNGSAMFFRYDPDTLAVVECEASGMSGAVIMKASATRTDGSASWERLFSSDEVVPVEGVSFLGVDQSGLPVGVEFSFDGVAS